MKTLMFAVACGALALMAWPQPASAGSGFSICIEGFCIDKGGRNKWRRHDHRSWHEYCHENPWDDRCNPYRYRPHPEDCYYSYRYGWQCY